MQIPVNENCKVWAVYENTTSGVKSNPGSCTVDHVDTTAPTGSITITETGGTWVNISVSVQDTQMGLSEVIIQKSTSSATAGFSDGPRSTYGANTTTTQVLNETITTTQDTNYWFRIYAKDNAGNIYTSGAVQTTTGRDGPTITVGGTLVKTASTTISKYLGKVVTNYKSTDPSAVETKSIKTGSGSTNRSQKTSMLYRLYYIDFYNKYGDGVNTIYLKADCTSNTYTLSRTTIGTNANQKIQNLNPELYKSGVTSPTATNNNMKAVNWLLRADFWAALKTSGNTTPIGSYVNYVVGAPSLEMFMDSYNMKYGLTGTEPIPGDYTAGQPRSKLFYRFNSGASGYQVGPSNSDQWDSCTSRNTIQSDTSIDRMYFPVSAQWYWLASPSNANSDLLSSVISSYDLNVYGREYGYVGSLQYSEKLCFCPLVSLQSTAPLVLAN